LFRVADISELCTTLVPRGADKRGSTVVNTGLYKGPALR